MINKHFNLLKDDMKLILNILREIFPNTEFKFIRLNMNNVLGGLMEILYYNGYEYKQEIYDFINKYLCENFSDKVIEDRFKFGIVSKKRN